MRKHMQTVSRAAVLHTGVAEPVVAGAAGTLTAGAAGGALPAFAAAFQPGGARRSAPCEREPRAG